MLQLKNISKSYKTGDLFQKALDIPEIVKAYSTLAKTVWWEIRL